MPGDVINVEVWAKYIDSNTSHWNALLANLMNAVILDVQLLTPLNEIPIALSDDASIFHPRYRRNHKPTTRKGLLNIEDDIKKHIPDFPSTEKITIANLASHTSGTPTLVPWQLHFTDEESFYYEEVFPNNHVFTSDSSGVSRWFCLTVWKGRVDDQKD